MHSTFCILIVDPHVQVASKTVAEGVEAKRQAIVEVMVDFLLDMEGITVSRGLVYVLDKLESYPVSGTERQQFAMCGINVTSCLSLL